MTIYFEKNNNYNRCGGVIIVQCNTSLKATPAPDRSLFLTGVDNETTDEDISPNLETFNINVRKSDRVSKTDGRCASYKLTVPATEFKNPGHRAFLSSIF